MTDYLSKAAAPPVGELRTIPLRVPPIDGESVTGWLHHWAHRLTLTTSELLAIIGLDRAQPGVTSPAMVDHAVRLTDDEAARLATVSGVPTQRLHAMTMAVWDDTFVDLIADRRYVPVAPWRPVDGVRACPGCLGGSGGRWLLRWHLPWSFACDTHQTLLLVRCPRCGNKLRRRIRATRILTDTATCHAPTDSGKYGSRCGYDLRDAAPSNEPLPVVVTEAQHWLDHLIDTATDSAGTDTRGIATRATLTELVALSRHTLTAGIATDLPYLTATLRHAVVSAHQRLRATGHPHDPDTDTAWQAAVITHAVRIWREPSTHRRDDWLRDLLAWDRNRGVAVAPKLIHREWRTTPRLRSDLLRILSTDMTRVGRLRWRSGTAVEAIPDLDHAHLRQRARHVPQGFWPELFAALVPPHTGRIETFQTTLAAAMLLPGAADPSLRAPEQHLSLTPRSATSHALRVIERLHPAALPALAQLAAVVDTSPIDYQRRRAICARPVLPVLKWRRLAADHGLPAGGARRLLHMQRLVHQRLTGAPVGLLPNAIRPVTSRQRGDYAAACDALTAPWRGAIDDYAARVLADHRIDEPLAWAPPISILGFELTTDRSLRTWFDSWAAGTPIRKIARGRHAAPAVIRLLMWSALPTPPQPVITASTWSPWRSEAPDRGDGRTSASGADSTGLSKPELDPPPQTATFTGQNRTHPKQTTHTTERRSNQSLNDVRPQWLRHRYQHDRATLNEIADELGIAATSVRRRLDHHHIPIRARGGASHRAVLQPPPVGLPEPLKQTLTQAGPSGWQRLERFALLAGHNTIRDAATAIGCHQPTLSIQLAWLENAVGHPLLERAQRGRPMTYTQHGRQLIDQIHEHRARSTQCSSPEEGEAQTQWRSFPTQ